MPKSTKGIVYSGEETCTEVTVNGKCNLKAYYMVGKKVKCGRHANKKTRIKLKKNPKWAELRQKEIDTHNTAVEMAAIDNTMKGLRGQLMCQKLRMMKNPEMVVGFLLVYPNNRHDSKKDGFGCASLSPMRLGPVKHNQPGLPDALSIENYHQFNKCFPNEIGEDGNPTPIFYEKRLEAYRDPKPHRHKYDSAFIKKMNKNFVTGNTKNTPMYSVHLDRDGRERHYTYVQSRFFYCKWYERLAKREANFRILMEKLDQGFNLCICGFDAYQPDKDLLEHYEDPSRPFGHELVLYSLLLITDPKDYPWNQYYEKHKEIYDPLSF